MASFDQDLLSVESAVDRRRIEGGTSGSALITQIESAKKSLENTRTALKSMSERSERIEDLLKGDS
jgi:methyl-accepting chemotaxis protein